MLKKDNETDKSGRIYRDSPNWTKTMNILKTDKWLKKNVYIQEDIANYLDLVIFVSIDEQIKQNENYDVINEPNFNSTDNNFIMFKYIDYKFNKDAETFEDIFNGNNYATTSDFKKCFIDLIINTYAGQVNKEEYKKEVRSK